MRFDRDMHHRRSIRLRDYDYAQDGAYFVTVCVQGRESLLGEVMGGEMVLSEAGRMVEEIWSGLPRRFPESVLDEFMVMPNHFQGILFLSDHPDNHVGAPLVGARNFRPRQERAPTRGAPTLGDIVGAFKSLTTNAYIHGVHEHVWPPYPGRLWQRNYHERIIRDDDELTNIRAYIRDNPARWDQDAENPATRPSGRPKVSVCAAEPNSEGR